MSGLAHGVSGLAHGVSGCVRIEEEEEEEEESQSATNHPPQAAEAEAHRVVSFDCCVRSITSLHTSLETSVILIFRCGGRSISPRRRRR